MSKPSPKGIRVDAISQGPIATRVASGSRIRRIAPQGASEARARSFASIDDVGVATAFLAHDAARLMAGETLYIVADTTSSTRLICYGADGM
jgi:enoyl-[acyl-carrier protein] reductase I